MLLFVDLRRFKEIVCRDVNEQGIGKIMGFLFQIPSKF